MGRFETASLRLEWDVPAVASLADNAENDDSFIRESAVAGEAKFWQERNSYLR